ncbi:MAG: DNA internalization-related competence protein ComEC/Rec2 [Stackebrandtia sp.]
MPVRQWVRGGAVGSRQSDPADLRLAVLAAGVWGGSLVAVRLSAWWGVGLALFAASAAVATWGRRRTAATRATSGWLRLLPLLTSVAAVGVFGGASVTAAQVAVRDAEPLRQWAEAGKTVTAVVQVDDDPRRPRDSTDATMWFPATLKEVTYGDRHVRLDVRVVVFADGASRKQTEGSSAEGSGADADADVWSELLPGQRLEVVGTLSEAGDRADLTAEILNTHEPPELLGEPPWWQTAAGVLREGLAAACADLPDDVAGLIRGIAIGDTRDLAPDVEADFQITGMTHLTAVSGFNVGIVTGAALLAATLLRAGPRTRLVVGLVVIVGFVVLVRPTPSVLRAAVMGSIALLSIVTGRLASALPSLSCAVIVLVAADPDLANQPGFALSVSATFGLMLFVTSWSSRLEECGWPRWAAVAVAVPAAAQLAVTPQLAAMTGAVSLVSIPANILAAPAAAPVMVLGVVAAVVSAVSADAAEFVVRVAAWPAEWLVLVARHGARAPGGSLPWPDTVGWALLLAALLVTALLVVRSRLARRLVAVVAIGLVVGLAPVRLWHGGWPPHGWLLAACDVGQGDALVLAAGAEGSAVVVDAGPSPTEIDDCLRRLGIDHVPLLVISHYHADHVGGVAGVYQGRRVDAVLGPHDVEPAAGRRQVVEAARDEAASGDATVLTRQTGDRLTVGEVRLEVLAAGEGFAGTRSDSNNNSLVLRAVVDGVAVLLTGDVEAEAQEALLGSGADLDVDVLKAPHHGSAYSSTAFFEAASPTVAVVSAGRDNDYGHPHPTVTRQLRRQGATILRTDRDGDAAVIAVADGLAVMTSPSR